MVPIKFFLIETNLKGIYQLCLLILICAWAHVPMCLLFLEVCTYLNLKALMGSHKLCTMQQISYYSQPTVSENKQIFARLFWIMNKKSQNIPEIPGPESLKPSILPWIQIKVSQTFLTLA
jgi:hypothetical protein